MSQEHAAGPVPLYLIPQALSTEIHRLGGTIAEITVTRTGGHGYAIRIRTHAQEAGRDE
ncbi:MAG: hypothetical protein JXA08_04275 [Methanomicrobiaceae archaeon]|nr:hypothetical protein [Methanomicrobiaceae archaeon]